MLIRSKHDGYWRDGIRLYLGGGGGNAAPPPDPRLVEAQINSLNLQADAANAIMEQSRALLPLQQQQMRTAIRAANTAYADSRVDRAYTLERRGHLTELQNRMISDAKSYNSAARGNELAMRGMADVAAQSAAARQATSREMMRRGVNPGSARFASMQNQYDLAEATSKAAMASAGRESARKEGYYLTDRAAGSLAGYPVLSLQTSQAGLAAGSAGLAAVNQGAAGMMSGFSAAAGAASGSGQTAAQLYGTQASSWNAARNADAQEEAGMWGAVGTGVGIYASIAI